MIINTKYSVRDEVYILLQNKVYTVIIERIDISIVNETTVDDITYTVEKNPAGTQYSTRFPERELFKTKQDLLDSL